MTSGRPLVIRQSGAVSHTLTVPLEIPDREPAVPKCLIDHSSLGATVVRSVSRS